MSGGNFTVLTEIVLFVACVWYAGRLCRLCHLSPIIGEIFTGITLGPAVLNLVPEVNKTHNGGYDSLWQVVGDLGVTLLIAESGTHIHFDSLKKVGCNALGTALIGTFTPLLVAMGLSVWMTKDPPNGLWLEAFAAGCCMAPTSVGIALALLNDAKQLNSLPGQTIVTGAFLDDVFSIILLVVLEALEKDISKGDSDGDEQQNGHELMDPHSGGSGSGNGSGNGGTSASDIAVQITLKFVYCALFLGLGMLAAVHIVGRFVPRILAKFEYKKGIGYQPRDEAHLMFMLGLLVLYGYIGHLIGSHLLGAFIAGMSFGQVQRSMLVWRRQIKRLSAWMIRFFFACTVAFSIPVGALFNLSAFSWGLLMAVLAAVFAKVVAGVATWEHKWVVGFAMVGRGEFAYVIAGFASSTQMLSDEVYAAVVWALLLAVVIAPIAFGKVLEMAFKNQSRSGITYFKIESSGPHHTGLHHEIVGELHALNLDIIEARVETDGFTDMFEFTVSCGLGDELDSGKIHEIEHDLKDAINDPQTQILCRPLAPEETENLMDLNLQIDDQPDYDEDDIDDSNGGKSKKSGYLTHSRRSHHNPNQRPIHQGPPTERDRQRAALYSRMNENEPSLTNGSGILTADAGGLSDSRLKLAISGNERAILPAGGSRSRTLEPSVSHSDVVKRRNSFSASAHDLFGSEGGNSSRLEAQRSYRNLKAHKYATIDKDHWLEVKLLASHCPRLFAEISGILEEDSLVVSKALLEGFGHTDSEVIYAKANPRETDGSRHIDLALIKREIRALISRTSKGDVMIRRMPVYKCVLPTHPKLSDLLQSGGVENNPLLQGHDDEHSDSESSHEASSMESNHSGIAGFFNDVFHSDRKHHHSAVSTGGSAHGSSKGGWANLWGSSGVSRSVHDSNAERSMTEQEDSVVSEDSTSQRHSIGKKSGKRGKPKRRNRRNHHQKKKKHRLLRGGYEIEIVCAENSEIAKKIFHAFDTLELDVRRLKIELLDEDDSPKKPSKEEEENEDGDDFAPPSTVVSVATDDDIGTVKEKLLHHHHSKDVKNKMHVEKAESSVTQSSDDTVHPHTSARSVVSEEQSRRIARLCAANSKLEFFVTEKHFDRFNADVRRREIEANLCSLLQALTADSHSMARVVTRAIEMKHDKDDDHLDPAAPPSLDHARPSEQIVSSKNASVHHIVIDSPKRRSSHKDESARDTGTRVVVDSDRHRKTFEGVSALDVDTDTDAAIVAAVPPLNAVVALKSAGITESTVHITRARGKKKSVIHRTVSRKTDILVRSDDTLEVRQQNASVMAECPDLTAAIALIPPSVEMLAPLQTSDLMGGAITPLGTTPEATFAGGSSSNDTDVSITDLVSPRIDAVSLQARPTTVQSVTHDRSDSSESDRQVDTEQPTQMIPTEAIMAALSHRGDSLFGVAPDEPDHKATTSMSDRDLMMDSGASSTDTNSSE